MTTKQTSLYPCRGLTMWLTGPNQTMLLGMAAASLTWPLFILSVLRPRVAFCADLLISSPSNCTLANVCLCHTLPDQWQVYMWHAWSHKMKTSIFPCLVEPYLPHWYTSEDYLLAWSHLENQLIVLKLILLAYS